MSRSNSPKRRRQQAPQNPKDICVPSGRKVRYKGRKRALNALGQARNSRTKMPSRPVAVYQCPHCYDWHLTSQERRNGKTS